MNHRFFLLVCYVLILSIIPSYAQYLPQEMPTEAYLPFRLELHYSYSMNFTLDVTPGTPGSSWDTGGNNERMYFEVLESRDTFVVVFEIKYPQTVEQIVTVQLTEGKRAENIRYIHFTGGELDPGANELQPPSDHIVLRYYIRTLPEPTDPRLIVELLQSEERAEKIDQKKLDTQRHNEVISAITWTRAAFVVLGAVLLACFVIDIKRRRRSS